MNIVHTMGLDFPRRRQLACGCRFCQLASQAATHPASQTKPLRIDVTPLIGYRTSIAFPAVQNGVATSGLSLAASPSYGVAAGVRLDEEDLVEFRWAKQDTHLHLAGSSERVTLNQFHGDFTHEYIPEDWPAWARPFVIGSVGATHLGAGSNSSFTRFSFGLGRGNQSLLQSPRGLEDASGMVAACDQPRGQFIRLWRWLRRALECHAGVTRRDRIGANLPVLRRWDFPYFPDFNGR